MDHKETHDEGLNFLIDSIIYSLVQSHTLIWDEYAKIALFMRTLIFILLCVYIYTYKYV